MLFVLGFVAGGLSLALAHFVLGFMVRSSAARVFATWLLAQSERKEA